MKKLRISKLTNGTGCRLFYGEVIFTRNLAHTPVIEVTALLALLQILTVSL